RQRARMVGDQQRATALGDVGDAERVDAEPLRVEELEQPLPARGGSRIAAEIVDDITAAPHRERAPAPPQRLDGKVLADIDREHRRAVLFEPALELAQLRLALAIVARHVTAIAMPEE